VPQVLVAIGQSLCVVAQIVLSKQPDWTCEPDLDPEIDQGVLEPFRALEAIVNQLAVVTERMPEQQHRGSGADKHRESRPAECQHATDQRTRRHADEPERLDWGPPDRPEPHILGVYGQNPMEGGTRGECACTARDCYQLARDPHARVPFIV